MENSMSRTTSVVDAIGRMDFSGNIVPHTWYKTIVYKNGKPDLNAIIILSEIVFWYRPVVELDEESGNVIGVRKKFKADMLQRSYQSFADKFGLTKRQCQDAIAHLIELGLVRRELRIVDTPQGKASNVLFLEPIPEAIQRDSYHVVTYDPPRSNVIPHTSERDTYTENTTNNSTENKQNIVADATASSTPVSVKEKSSPKKKAETADPPPKTSGDPPSQKEPTDWQKFLEALCWVCHGHKMVGDLTDDQRGSLVSEAKKIKDRGYVIDDLKEWYVKTWKKNWKYKRDESRPTPAEVRSSIPVLKSTVPNGFDATGGKDGQVSYNNAPSPESVEHYRRLKSEGKHDEAAAFLEHQSEKYRERVSSV